MIFEGQDYRFYGVDVDALILSALCTEQDFLNGADDRQLMGHVSARVSMVSMPVVWESLGRLRKHGLVRQNHDGFATVTQMGIDIHSENWPSEQY